MAHPEGLSVYAGVVGQQLTLAVFLDATLTGLALGDLDVLLVVNDIEVIGTPEIDLEMELLEVNSMTAPGYYLLKLIPDRIGTIFISLTEAAHTLQLVVQVVLATVVADPSLEGDYTVTVKQGVTPVPGATVRVYNSFGTLLIARKISDSLGEATFPLEAGQYQVRINKDGFDFSDMSPSLITVLPNDNVIPRLDEIVPGTASIGDVIMLLGAFFHETDTEILFGTEATVPPDSISATLTALTVTVPAGLTQVAIPVRVRKPDPESLGYLYSNIITFVRV